jgi:hypothetical protein
MSKITILAVGTNKAILQNVMNVIGKHGAWNGIEASGDEAAIEKFHQHPVDVALFTDGLSDEEEKKLRKIFTHQDSGIIIIRHYGNNFSLLPEKIGEALDKRREENKPSVSFTDDALKNAKLNINIQ